MQQQNSDRTKNGRCWPLVMGALAKGASSAAILAAMTCGLAFAQSTYPTKPVRFIVPFAPGGGTDITARLITEGLREALGQPVIIENRGGAGGIVGTQAAARSAPDGYTLLLGYTGALTINPHLYKELPYKPLEDFDPVSLAVSSPFLFVLHPSVPANSVAELIALAKSRKDPLNYGSSGNGSLHHLGMEWLSSLTGTKMVHVPYQGAKVFAAVIAGDIHMTFASVIGMLSTIKAGRAKVIAITSRKRSQLLPDTPTMMEAGIPNFEAANWFGVVVPAKTPAPIVTRLSSVIATHVNSDEMKKRLATDGGEPIGSTPQEFAKLIRAEYVRWGEVVKASGATAD